MPCARIEAVQADPRPCETACCISEASDVQAGVNLLAGSAPQSDLMHFHDTAMRTITIFLVTCVFLAFGIGRLQVSFFATFAVIGVASFALRARLEKLRDAYVREQEARRERQYATKDESFPGESVAWLNEIIAAVWPLTNPDLFVSILDIVRP